MDALLAPFLDDSHRAYRETCRRFAEAEIAPHAHAWEEAEEFPRELYRKAAEAGILGPLLPDAYGGGGGDVLHAFVQIEELLKAGSSGVLAGLSSLAIALPAVVALGTDEQKERFLRPVLAGEEVAALAVTEPDAGSDVAAIRTRAVRDGDAYVLDGAKTFITSGRRADRVTVLARTGEDPRRGLTFFMVSRDTPGFATGRDLKKMGWRASDTAELFFEGCRVPVEDRLGEEGTGFATLMRTFEVERLSLAAFGHASAAVALAHAEAYARERRAFGQRLVDFQALRHRLVEMRTRTLAATAFNYQVADAHRRGEDIRALACHAKNFAAEVAHQVCDGAVQVLGGGGFLRETPVERLYRDVRLLSIGGGTTEVLRELAGRDLVAGGSRQP